MSEETRLKLAIQKSGRLSDESIKLLSQCGIKLVKSKDQLFCRSENFPIDVYFVRDDDIPAFVSTNVCSIGIVGQNVLFEEKLSSHNKAMKDIKEILELGFGKCRLSLAVPHDFNYQSPQCLNGKKIATSYEGILKDYFEKKNMTCDIVYMQGSVEIAPRINMTDAICDLVSTGATLATNGLKEVETIFESQAVLISNDSMNSGEKELLERLTLRIQGVKQAGASKYIMLHSPKSSLEEIKSILPGSESPTILNIQGRDDMVAIHAVCNESVFWDTMEDLKKKGASSILVLPIEKILD